MPCSMLLHGANMRPLMCLVIGLMQSRRYTSNKYNNEYAQLSYREMLNIQNIV